MKTIFTLFFSVFFAACGSTTTKEYVPVERNGNGNGGGSSGGGSSSGGSTGSTSNYATVSRYLQESCGNAGCHAGAGFLKSESNLRGNSQVRNRIANGSMPPRYAGNYNLWEDGKRKAAVLAFFNQ